MCIYISYLTINAMLISFTTFVDPAADNAAAKPVLKAAYGIHTRPIVKPTASSWDIC